MTAFASGKDTDTAGTTPEGGDTSTASTEKPRRGAGRKKGRRGPGRPRGSRKAAVARGPGRRGGRRRGGVALSERKRPGRKPRARAGGAVTAQAGGPAEYVVLVKKGRGYRQFYCDGLKGAKRQVEQLLQGGSRVETISAYKQLKVGIRREAVIG